MDMALVYDPVAVKADIALSGSDALVDHGLQTAVILSLFTHARANTDDVLPDGGDDRRGFWADTYSELQDDNFGSRLWLLSREKQTGDVLNRAREYAQESLQWLIDDGVAASVDVNATWARTGVLSLQTIITKPSGDNLTYQFEQLWKVA